MKAEDPADKFGKTEDHAEAEHQESDFLDEADNGQPFTPSNSETSTPAL
jgi:hypothetical protein